MIHEYANLLYRPTRNSKGRSGADRELENCMSYERVRLDSVLRSCYEMAEVTYVFLLFCDRLSWTKQNIAASGQYCH